MPGKRSPLAEIMDTFQRNRAALAQEVERVPEVLLHTPPASGGWSVAQALAHIAAADMPFLERIDAMLARPGGDVPMLRGIQDAPLHPSVGRTTRAQFLEQLRAQEPAVLQRLARLAPADLKVDGAHPRFGRVSVEWVVKHLAEHVEEHRAQIAETARKVASDPPPDVGGLALEIERALAAFTEAFARMPDRHLHSVPKPGEWTPVQIAVHMVAAEKGYVVAIDAVRAAPGGPLPGIPGAAEAPLDPGVRSLARGQIVDLLAEAREKALAHARQVKPAELRLYGVNPRRGPMSIEFMLRREAAHPLEHRLQLLETLETLARTAT